MNLFKMMQQAKAVQERLKALEEELRALTVTGEAGAGLVRVVVSGERRVQKIEVDPTIWEEERELALDLIAAAVNDALAKLDEAVQAKQREVLAGLPLPPGMLGA